MRAAVLVLSLGLAGCGTFLSKDRQIGHIYSGITYDAIAVRCVWEMPGSAKEEGTSYLLSIPIALIGTIIYGVDLPFSFVADTLFIPLDLLDETVSERRSLLAPCDYSPQA
jgi:uncharacterized protein YceK